MALINQSRPDNSGGFMQIAYSNGSYNHRMRVHFDKVTANDATMTYLVAHGTEHTVFDSFNSLCNILKVAYDPTWSFQLSGIYLNVGVDPTEAGQNLFQQQFGWAAPAAIAGSGVTVTAPAQAPGMFVDNFHTLAGGRMRIFWISPGGWVYAVPQVNAPLAGGNGHQALAAYLTGANTGITGHDGAKATGNARTTFPYNRRLRRHYNQA